MTESHANYQRRRAKDAERRRGMISKDFYTLARRGLHNGLIVAVLKVKYGVSRATVYNAVDLKEVEKIQNKIRAMLGSNPLGRPE